MKLSRWMMFLFIFGLICTWKPAQAQLWRTHSDPNSNHWMNSIVVDSQKNTYVAGTGPGDFFTSTFGSFAKYDPQGNLLWQFENWFSLYPARQITGLVLDANDNPIVTGYAIIGNEPICFIQKHNSQGTLLWSQIYRGSLWSPLLPNGGPVLKVDPQGNSYLLGRSNIEAGQDRIKRLFLCKYDPNGQLLWERAYVHTPDASVGRVGLELDPQDNLRLLATSADTVGEGHLIKYSSSGELVWDRPITIGYGMSNRLTSPLAIDSQGRTLVAGTYPIPDSPNTNLRYGWRIFLYDADGNEAWRDGGEMTYVSQYPVALAFDHANHPIVIITRDNLNDIYKFQPDGRREWSKQYPTGGYGSDSFVTLGKILIDDANNISCLGDTVNAGVRYALAIRYRTSGELDWSFRYAEAPGYSVQTGDMALDTQGYPYLVVNGVGSGGLYSRYTVMKLNPLPRRIVIKVSHPDGNGHHFPVNYTVKDQDTGRTVESGQQLTFEGVLILQNLEPGRYRIAAAPAGFLQQVISVDTTNGEVTDSVSASYFGDLNGDNSIDVYDLIVMAQSYNRVSPDSRYNIAADYNLDGANAYYDFRWLLNNFHRRGNGF